MPPSVLQRALQLCRVFLVNNLDTPDLCDELLANGILNNEDYNTISVDQVRQNRVRTLLDKLQRSKNSTIHFLLQYFRRTESTSDIYDEFWKAVKKANLENKYEEFCTWEELSSVSAALADKSSVKRSSQGSDVQIGTLDIKSLVLKWKSTLCEITICNQRLLDVCVEKEIITPHDANEIILLQLNYDRNHLFYSFVEKMDKISYAKLIEIMAEFPTKQSEDILSILSANRED